MTESYRFKEYHIRPDMLEAIERYVQHGIRPGHFLTAVLKNNFMRAAQHADEGNLRNLPAYAAYLYNELPGPCHGSPQAVEAWVKMGGLNGTKKGEAA